MSIGFFSDATCKHKATDIISCHAIDRLEERGVERGSARRSSLKGRDGHRQSDEYLNSFKGDVGETSKRRGGADQ